MSTAPAASGAVEPKTWQTGLVPASIGVFLWIVFSDQLGRRALPVGGLVPALLGVLAAGPLAYLLLFRIPAAWGFLAARPLDGVAAATFGERGARLVPGLLLAIGQIAVFALAVGSAVALTFQGLILVGLLDPASLRTMTVGAGRLPSPLFLGTSLFWAVATALVSVWFTRWIAALMQYFPIFPAAALALAMVGALVGLPRFRPSGLDPTTGVMLSPRGGAISAFLLTFQWVFAFSTPIGITGADWGRGTISLRDLRVGGWLGVALAPIVVASLALLTVAGHEGLKMPADPPPFFEPSRTYGRGAPAPSTSKIEDGPSDAPAGLDSPPYTLRSALAGGFDRRLGAALLVIFGLGSLAPACYASFALGQRLASLGPSLGRPAWTVLGAVTAWFLIVAGWADRPAIVLDLLGAAFAPVAGAIAADYAIRRGRWPGPRRGFNPAGMLAWVFGATVGAFPTAIRALGSPRTEMFRPAALAAFLVAFLAYGFFALLRLETKPLDEGS